jgi:hypothetical protein
MKKSIPLNLLLYKNLIRITKEFDKFEKFKILNYKFSMKSTNKFLSKVLLNDQIYYFPRKIKFSEELYKFSIESKEENLDEGFQLLRYFNDIKFQGDKLNLKNLNNEIKFKYNKELFNDIEIIEKNDIEIGDLLISHPLVLNVFKNSVILITSKSSKI